MLNNSKSYSTLNSYSNEIEVLTIEGVGAKEISDRLRNVYKESALSYASVRRWVVQFKSGNSDISNKPRSGRPSTDRFHRYVSKRRSVYAPTAKNL